jgi:small subunit ribosomal protein S2
MENEGRIDELFKVGAHFGYGRSRRSPTVARFVFGTKNAQDVVDLNKTIVLLDAAKEYARTLGKEGKKLMFVGNKHEAREVVKNAAVELGMPYVAMRWIGGTLTNFSEVKKRIARVKELREMKTGGGFEGYTKGERALFQKELAKLETTFEGILEMTSLPQAIFVVDSKSEETAVLEARKMGIPVISISGTDCDVSGIDYPVVANDSSRSSIGYFVGQIADAFRAGVTDKAKEASEAKS